MALPPSRIPSTPHLHAQQILGQLSLALGRHAGSRPVPFSDTSPTAHARRYVHRGVSYVARRPAPGPARVSCLNAPGLFARGLGDRVPVHGAQGRGTAVGAGTGGS